MEGVPNARAPPALNSCGRRVDCYSDLDRDLRIRCLQHALSTGAIACQSAMRAEERAIRASSGVIVTCNILEANENAFKTRDREGAEAIFSQRKRPEVRPLFAKLRIVPPERERLHRQLGRLPRGRRRRSSGFEQHCNTTLCRHFAELCFKGEIDGTIREECDYIAALSDCFTECATRRKCAKIPIDNHGDKRGDHGYKSKKGPNGLIRPSGQPFHPCKW